MQSMLFSATYYGGLITVLPGGVLADRFSPKIILLLAIADYVIVSLFTPLIANANYYAFFVARIFMGFGEVKHLKRSIQFITVLYDIMYTPGFLHKTFD